MANIVNASLYLWIYTGDYGAKDPLNPNYVLYKEVKTGSDIITFEIAELVKDYVEVTFTGDYTNITQSAWVEWEMVRNYDDDSTDTTLKGNAIAFNGYGYFKDAINPQLSNDVLISNTNIYHNCVEGATEVIIGADRTDYTADDTVLTADLDVEGGSEYNRLYIPILGGEDGATSVTYYDAVGAVIRTETISSEGSIANLTADTTEYTADGTILTADMTYLKSADSEITEVIEAPKDARTIEIIRSDGSTKYLYIKCIDCSKYDPYKVSFVNKFGVIQDIWFDKKRTDSTEITNSTYKQTTLNESSTGVSYSINQASIMPNDFALKKRMTLNTGFVDDEYNEVIQQLMLTENAWIHEEGTVYPILPMTKSLQYKTSLNDRLVNFTIEFEYAFNEINLIR